VNGAKLKRDENWPHQLLVEGADDGNSIRALTCLHGLDWDRDTRLPHVRERNGGKDVVLDQIQPLLASPTCARLGIVLDADQDHARRWAAVRDRCARGGVTLRENAEPAGTITEGGHPPKRVGVWLMPDNSQPGALEDFLLKLAPTEDPCWQRAREAVTGAVAANCARDARRLKHDFRTWLAWQEPPGMPFGVALTKKLLGSDSPEALAFVAWFRRLFVED
jgi:hypothetical protein